MKAIIQKIIQNSTDPKLIERAFESAQKAHAGQKRFSGEEYLLHPLRVAQILSDMHLDPKAVAAGLLHDVPDDTEKTLEDIEKEKQQVNQDLEVGDDFLDELLNPEDTAKQKAGEEGRTAEHEEHEPEPEPDFCSTVS